MSALQNFSRDPRRSHDPMFDFLDAYDNCTWSNDDGALLGQLQMLRDGGTFAPGMDDKVWQQAVSRALSAT
ncbi:MAG TPA: hypothetical protein VGK37_17170 [Casimicrobiaceae bacterium]